MSDDKPRFTFLKDSIDRFFKQVSVPSPHREAGGQEIKIDSLPGMGEQKPALPETEDLSAQIPDISKAIDLPNPDVEYIDVCAVCRVPQCGHWERVRIPVRRK